jgi:hypothetical protein
LFLKKKKIKNIVWANELWKQRQQLKAEYKAQGKLLDFNDDLDTKPVINEDGTINKFLDTGIESRGDWLGALNKLFEGIKNNELISKMYGDLPEGSAEEKSVYLKSILSKINSNQEILRPDGTNYSRDMIQAVIDDNVNEFIEADPDGNQMYRWFKKYYMGEERASNPEATEDELELIAETKAKQRIKEAIQDIGNKYRNKIESIEQLLEVKSNPNYKASSTSNANTGGEKPYIPEQISTSKVSYVPGSEYSSYSEYQNQLEAYDAKYNPNTFNSTDPYRSIKSIDAAQKSLFQIGPDNDLDESLQFKNYSPSKRGGLQMLDAELGLTGDNNRAVYSIKKDNVDDYINYLIDSGTFKKNDPQIKAIRQSVNDDGEYKVPTMRLREETDGSTVIEMDPFFEEIPEVATNVKSFIDDHARIILSRSAHIDNLKSQKRALLERESQAMKAAGFATRAEYEEAVSEDPNLKGRVNEARKTRDVELFQYLTLGNNSSFSSRLLLKLDEANALNPLAALYEEANKEGGEEYLRNLSKALGSEGRLDQKFFETYLKNKNVDISKINEGDLMRFASYFGENFVSTLNFAGKELINKLDSDYQKRLGDINPRLKAFYDNIESMENDYYVNGLIINIPKETPQQKSFYESLTNIVASTITGPNNKLYRVTPDDANTAEKAFTLSEAFIAEGIMDPEDPKNDAVSGIRGDATKGFKIRDIRFDTVDGLVLDLEIGPANTYEVRNIDGLDTKLIGMGVSAKKLQYMDQANKSLKNGDMVSGRIGGQRFDETDFFVAQFDDDNTRILGSDNTLKKGQYYIYTSENKRIGFDNLNQLINWHINNKDKVFDKFNELGTPLSLSDKEFKIRYPGINKDDYKDRLVKEMTEYLEKALPPENELNAQGFSQDDMIYSQDYSDKPIGDSYLKPISGNYTDLSLQFKEEDITKVGNSYVVEPVLHTEETLSNLNISSKGGKKVVTIPSLINALGDLRNLGFDNNIVITQSIRSYNQHKNLYTHVDPKRKVKYSAHMQGLALDIRTESPDGEALINFLETDTGYKWLKDNNLRALVHKIAGNEWHLDLKYNADIKTGSNWLNSSDQLYINEKTGVSK